MTIAKVVRDFRDQLPEADIYVYDNNSTDDTVEQARQAGALIGYERRQGKGHVVRTMLREVVADCYVMVDGDDTYPPDRVHALMEPVLTGAAHMSVGTRLEQYDAESFRPFHRIGNRLIRLLINTGFDADLSDILSGYRCFNALFVKSVPLLSTGFELETELTLQALDKGLVVMEIPVAYGRRPPGSSSKLHTYLDGMILLWTIFTIFKDYRPLRFFSALALMALLAGLGFGSIPIIEFIETRYVAHVPTAILATGLVLVSVLSAFTGFILDTLKRRQQEQYHLIVNLITALRRHHER
jgi:glycosyltransferase involved in cell wall biosynthesis